MNLLSASTLLSVWERGLVQRPHQLAITLLTASLPEIDPDTIARAPVGKRDGWLLELRKLLFGSRFNCVSSCPHCRERLEVSFEARDITRVAETAYEESYTCVVDGFSIRFRLPDSTDLEAIAPLANPQQGRDALVQRCLTGATRNGSDTSVKDLPDDVVSAVIDRIGDLDPQADISVALVCPSCGEQWHAVFDIVSFLWKEVSASAHRTLQDVHDLASAYGWNEADILAMSPVRRATYLKLRS
jgi:hypothetical protein